MGIEPTRILPGEEVALGPRIEDVQSLRTKPLRPVLLVMGDGRCLFEDLERFLDLEPPAFDTMAINYSVTVCPWAVQHFVAGDSHMRDMQRLAMQSNGATKHCWNPNSVGFDVRWIRDRQGGWNGTTGNLAVQIGIALGYLKIVMAGCPMDHSGNWYTDELKQEDVKKDKNHAHHLWKWTEMSLRPRARFIRSLSGNTADLFGEPDHDWLWNAPKRLNSDPSTTRLKAQ